MQFTIDDTNRCREGKEWSEVVATILTLMEHELELDRQKSLSGSEGSPSELEKHRQHYGVPCGATKDSVSVLQHRRIAWPIRAY